MATRDDSTTPDTGPMVDRRTLVKGMAGALAMSAVGGGALLGASGAAAADAISSLPAWRIAELIASGQLAAVQVTGQFLARTQQSDPRLLAFQTLDAAGAWAQARAADAWQRGGKPVGALHRTRRAWKEHTAGNGLP